MKHLGRVLLGLSVLMMLISCGSSYEAKGDKAYRAAQKAQGNERRLKQKTAYIMYQRAIKAHPNRVSTKLRDRFIEMSLVRANMVLREGSAELDALPLFVADMDTLWGPDVPKPLKQEYADFLVRWADSSIARGQISEALDRIDKAIEVSGNDAKYSAKREAVVGKVVEDMYELANLEYEEGKLNEDEQSMVRAEYHVKVALALDSTHEKARELLGKLRKVNRGTYSGYLGVIEDIQDTVMFDKVNKYGVLMAVPAVLRRGGTVTLKVSMYNYSYDPQRLWAKSFKLIDVNGNEYTAHRSSRINPEILDQEKETELKLVFSKPKAKIKKLVYDHKEHHSEKYFF